MEKTFYSWRRLEDKSRDLGMFEIRRAYGVDPDHLDTSEKPFTVLLYNFSKVGPRGLFNDIFYSNDWNETRSDVDFLVGMWKELGLEGEFHLDKVEHNLWKAPIVYRNTIENVMAKRFGVVRFGPVEEGPLLTVIDKKEMVEEIVTEGVKRL